MAKPDYRKLCADRTRLRRWYMQGLGRLLLEREQELLDQVLHNLFGFYLVQVGCPAPVDLARASRVRYRVVLDCDGEDVASCGDVEGGAAESGDAKDASRLPPVRVGLRGRPEALPLQRDSVDVILLPHILEFEPHPHEVLREVERVLVAEGHVVILGFNPWSWWGCWRLLRRRRGHPPWYGDFRSVLRIKDWLALLGFDVEMTRMYFFRPPLRHARVMRRLGFLERLGRRWWPFFGGGYLIVAKKRVMSLTPIKPRWRPRRPLVQVDLARRVRARHRSRLPGGRAE